MKKLLLSPLFLLCTIGMALAQDEFEMKDGDTTYIMKKYYFCLLKRGPNKDLDSLQLVDIQKGHLAHIDSLAKAGKIAIAGPFESKGDMRGILIFNNVSSVDEVIKLQSGDPAVKAGRLIVEVLPWWAAKGSILP